MEPLIGDDRAGILLAPLFLLNGDIEFDDGAADEDELLAEASDMIPTCIVGIHEFWRSYRKPPPAEDAASQEAADASDATTGSDRQHGGSGRQSHRQGRRRLLRKQPPRYRKLALAALKPLARPTEAMVGAAHAC